MKKKIKTRKYKIRKKYTRRPKIKNTLKDKPLIKGIKRKSISKKNDEVKLIPEFKGPNKNELPLGGRIYILYTGGTIGMIHSDDDGLVPIKGNLIKLIKKLNIDAQLNIEYVIESLHPLIDSSDLKTIEWKKIIAKLIENKYSYDSFIILHGTDTLAYTASALSFFLRSFNRSVIVTGSQIPLFEFRNDAMRNVIDSIIISLLKIPEVMIVFGGKILRGNCTSKISSTDFAAFGSPNLGDIGNIGVHINIYKNKLYQHNSLNLPSSNGASNCSNETQLLAELDTTHWTIKQWKTKILIQNVKLLPENNSTMLNNVIDLNPNAIIIRSYGIGNAPMSDKKFVKALKRANKKNIILVNATQCLYGGVNMDYYKTGRDMKAIGVIGAQDMTEEAIFAKLFYLLQVIGTTPDKKNTIESLFETNLAGEITVNQYDVNVRNYLTNYFNLYQEL